MEIRFKRQMCRFHGYDYESGRERTVFSANCEDAKVTVGGDYTSINLKNDEGWLTIFLHDITLPETEYLQAQLDALQDALFQIRGKADNRKADVTQQDLNRIYESADATIRTLEQLNKELDGGE